MNEQPLVSICIQTYQHALYIEQCIQSVLSQQTTFPFEIILGEDGSTDGTRKICKEYKDRYPDRINLFLREEKDKIWIDGEKTGRYNFIHNLKAARGKYIALLDGDDYWNDNLKLQTQVDFLEKNFDYNLCFCDPKILKKGKLTTVCYLHPRKKVYSLDTIPHINSGTAVFRNPGFETIPEHLWQTFFLDVPLYMYVTGAGKIRRIAKYMAVYRMHDKGIWSGKSKEVRCLRTIQVYRLLLPLYTNGTRKILYRKLERDIKYLFKIYAKTNNVLKLRELARQIVADELFEQSKGLKKYCNRIHRQDALCG